MDIYGSLILALINSMTSISSPRDVFHAQGQHVTDGEISLTDVRSPAVSVSRLASMVATAATTLRTSSKFPIGGYANPIIQFQSCEMRWETLWLSWNAACLGPSLCLCIHGQAFPRGTGPPSYFFVYLCHILSQSDTWYNHDTCSTVFFCISKRRPKDNTQCLYS